MAPAVLPARILPKSGGPPIDFLDNFLDHLLRTVKNHDRLVLGGEL